MTSEDMVVLPKDQGHDVAVRKLLHDTLVVVPIMPAIVPRVMQGTWLEYWSSEGGQLSLTQWQWRHHRAEIRLLTGVDVACAPPCHSERVQALFRRIRKSNQDAKYERSFR